MNICIISQDFSPAIGGVAAHVDNLSKALSEQGHRVTVATIRYDFQLPFRKVDGVREILRFWVPNISKVRGLFFFIQAAPILLFLGILRRFKVVHWHNILPDTLIAWMVPAKRGVFTNHTSTFLELYAANRRRAIFNFILARAGKIIGPSLELTEKSISFFNRNSQNVHYVPNGVDTRAFSPLNPEDTMGLRQEWLTAHSLPLSSRIIFCPRRLEPKNGVVFAVHAMQDILKKFPEALLVVAGNDAVPEYAQAVRKLIVELKLESRVILLGAVRNMDMPKLYRLAEVAVLPSLMEATSIAGLEAMASGVPLIGAKVGGIPEIIEDGVTGLLVSPQDHSALAMAICKLLADNSLRHGMAVAARRRAEEEFSWSKIAARTAGIYIEP